MALLRSVGVVFADPHPGSDQRNPWGEHSVKTPLVELNRIWWNPALHLSKGF